MSNDIFDGQILAEKLSKLNNSQQSIESLSRWCIPHQKRAKDIVEIWDNLFNASQKEQRVSFLNLANDILQNSKRKGSEFVNEFWKVLPATLRCVYESGDVHGRKAVNRLGAGQDPLWRMSYKSGKRSLSNIWSSLEMQRLLEILCFLSLKMHCMNKNQSKSLFVLSC
ncbi:hypothetical protein RYX36_007468 [Vicia faba]